MSASGQTSHRHHYLPQFYLRQWAGEENGLLWRYRREPSGKVSEMLVSPKGTAYGEDLYSVRDVVDFMPEHKPDSIETEFFSRIDNDAASALDLLLKGGCASMPDGARAAWALFLNSLLERVPSVISEREKVGKVVAERITTELRGRASTDEHRARIDSMINRMDLNAAGRNAVLECMVQLTAQCEVIEYFKRCEWRVVPRHESFEFVTADYPVIVNAGGADRPIHMMSIALSPSRLFVMFPASWSAEFDDTFIRLLVMHYNPALLNRPGVCVYSRDKLRDGPVLRMRKAVDLRLRSTTGAIRSRR